MLGPCEDVLTVPIGTGSGTDRVEGGVGPPGVELCA